MQHGGFPTTSGSKNKINIAIQAAVDDVLDKLRFVNEIRTQLLSQPGEEVRTHRFQDTSAISHRGVSAMGVSEMSGFEVVTCGHARARTTVNLVII